MDFGNWPRYWKLILFAFFLFEKCQNSDERFYANLAKAVSLMFVLYRRTDPNSYHWVYGVSHSLHGTDIFSIAALICIFGCLSYLGTERISMAKENNIITNLKSVRESTGMTGRVSRPHRHATRTILHLENNRYNPSLEMALKIAQVLILKSEDLFELRQEA